MACNEIILTSGLVEEVFQECFYLVVGGGSNLLQGRTAQEKVGHGLLQSTTKGTPGRLLFSWTMTAIQSIPQYYNPCICIHHCNLEGIVTTFPQEV